MDKPENKELSKKEQRTSNQYLKYSNLAFQMLVTIGVAGWLGYELDQYLHLRIPAFMLLFVMLSLAGIIIKLIRSVNQD
ncbi:MAG: AtpZ/AtpI family protein [Bacteroidota bacterium]